jgi:uncharacterized protein YlxW (UPF0749 family)
VGNSGPARRAALKAAGAAAFALAGLLFWAGHDTARGTDLRTDQPLLQLSDRARQVSARNQRLDGTLSGLRGDIDRLTHADDGESPAARRRLAALQDAAGTTPLTGPAVTVTLDDAPTDATPLVPGVPDPTPDDLVIHQQDLQAVVNALWRGGARGIRVMDQRLVATSAVRCVGNTLILQGRVYSPPYRITAIGDPAALHRALGHDPDITTYREYVRAYGLGWKTADSSRLTLPGWTGGTSLHEAVPLPSPSAGRR